MVRLCAVSASSSLFLFTPTPLPLAASYCFTAPTPLNCLQFVVVPISELIFSRCAFVLVIRCSYQSLPAVAVSPLLCSLLTCQPVQVFLGTYPPVFDRQSAPLLVFLLHLFSPRLLSARPVFFFHTAGYYSQALPYL